MSSSARTDLLGSAKWSLHIKFLTVCVGQIKVSNRPIQICPFYKNDKYYSSNLPASEAMDNLKIMGYQALCADHGSANVLSTRWTPQLRGGHGRHGTHLQFQYSSAKRNQGNVDVSDTLQQYLSIQTSIDKIGGIEAVTYHAIMTFKDL